MRTLTRQTPTRQTRNRQIRSSFTALRSAKLARSQRNPVEQNGHLIEQPFIVEINQIKTWGDMRAFGDCLRVALEGHIVGQAEMIQTSIAALLTGIKPIFIGGSGIGKTFTARKLVEILGFQGELFSLDKEVTCRDITGYPKLDPIKRDMYYVPSPFLGIDTMDVGQKGQNEIVVLDELNRTSVGSQTAFFNIISNNEVYVVSLGTYLLNGIVTVIATMNPPEYAGTNPISTALADRFDYALHVPSLSDEDLDRMTFHTCNPPEVPNILQTGVLKLQNKENEMPIEVRFMEDPRVLVKQSRELFQNTIRKLPVLAPEALRTVGYILKGFRGKEQKRIWKDPGSGRMEMSMKMMATINAILKRGNKPNGNDVFLVAPGCFGLLETKDYTTTDERMKLIRDRLLERYNQRPKSIRSVT